MGEDRSDPLDFHAHPELINTGPVGRPFRALALGHAWPHPEEVELHVIDAPDFDAHYEYVVGRQSDGHRRPRYPQGIRIID
jgi:hypothetical protein